MATRFVKPPSPQDDNTDAAAVTFVDASYSYAQNQQVAALTRINFAIEKGEFVAVVGSNGCGKSTLSKLVNALLTPCSGRVFTMGLDTAQEQGDVLLAIRSQAGLVLQNPDSQIVASVVADDIAFGPENLCVPHREIVTRVEDALAAVKMSERRHANPVRLSGGQKQRVCIAGMLAMQPSVLVLDEPGAMLDIRGRRGVLRTLHRLHKQGMTVILITQSMEEAANAQRVLVLNKGQVLMSGAPREVFKRHKLLVDIGLDVPFSVRLAVALRQLGLLVPDVASPDELLQALSEARTGTSADVSDTYAGAKKNDIEDSTNSALSDVRAGVGFGQIVLVDNGRLSGARTSVGAHVSSERADAGANVSDAQTSVGVGSKGAGASNPTLLLRDARFAYSSNDVGNEALRGVSLNLGAGELLGVVGHTGSGKTTLLQLIAGLIRAQNGLVQVAGLDLSLRQARCRLHSLVGMVFQYPERQFFAPTVAEEIAFGPHNAGLDKTRCDKRVREAMRLLGLDYERFAQRSPFELSGGEKRRVAVASVIAADPKILVFDEPTAGLDVSGQRYLQAFISGLKQRKKTIVLASHSLDLIAELADHVLVLDHGTVAMQGSPADVFASHNANELRRINLGLPRAALFALELQAAGLNLPAGIFTVEPLAQAIILALKAGHTGKQRHIHGV
ncbi:MAG: energy-coupling factor transporter ATPase [Coriobacteriales bacterium]|jgi:energy-coupling factor transport system ATP-binding protein|nr:energy-coupling factor transporter ATPase [Coriobacteriales bacterium]